MRNSWIIALCLMSGCKARSESPAGSPTPAVTLQPRPAIAPSQPVVESPVAQPSVERPSRFSNATEVTPYGTYVKIHPVETTVPGWTLTVQRRILELDWDRARKPEEQTEELGAMLEELRVAYPEAIETASVQMGLSTFAYPEFVERLARHALLDPQWKPRPGKLHEYVVQATREHSFHGELNTMFAAIDRVPKLESVEKCSTSKTSSRDELGEWLRERDIRTEIPVPVGCLMARFSLEPPTPMAEAH